MARRARTSCAVVPAAGFGERLRPLTLAVPKPAIPFLNRPVICRVFDQLSGAGVEKAFVNLHHLGGKVEEALEPYGRGMEVVFSLEREILGTYGLFSKFKEMLPGTFFVVNGDIVLDLPLSRLDRELAARPGLEAVLLVRKLGPSEKHTPVLFEGGTVREVGTGSHHFCGVYIARASFLDGIRSVEKADLATILREKAGKGLLGAVEHEGDWFDLGTAGDYIRATGSYMEKMKKGSVQVPRGSVLETRGEAILLRDGRATVAPASKLSGFVVAGAGSSVAPGASLENCVLLNGARVAEGVSMKDAVAYPGGALRA